MFGFPTQLKYLLPPLSLLFLLFLFHFVAPHNALVLNLNLFWDGEIWRLVTGQLLHSNDNHLYLNTAGLALVWALHGQYYPNLNFYKLVLLGLLSVGIGTVIFAKADVYYGLSGLLHFMLTWGACLDIIRLDNPIKTISIKSIFRHTGLLLLIGLVLKIVYENLSGEDLELAQTINASVAVEIHAVGVVAALVSFLIYLAIKKAA